MIALAEVCAITLQEFAVVSMATTVPNVNTKQSLVKINCKCIKKPIVLRPQSSVMFIKRFIYSVACLVIKYFSNKYSDYFSYTNQIYYESFHLCSL